MRRLVTSALFAAVGLLSGNAALAASLGLATDTPSLTADTATVTFFDLFTEGDLSTFATIDAASGVSLAGMGSLGFGVGFDLVDPALGLSGGFDISDDDGVFLAGDIAAVGFGTDLVEFLFDNLSGTAAASFSGSVLMAISFDPTHALGAEPFSAFADGADYTASVTLSNVTTSPIPLPAGLPLLLVGLAGLAVASRRNWHHREKSCKTGAVHK